MAYKLGYRTHNLQMWAGKAGKTCTCVSIEITFGYPVISSLFWLLRSPPVRTALNNSSATLVWLWLSTTCIILISKLMVLWIEFLVGEGQKVMRVGLSMIVQIPHRPTPLLPCENMVRIYCKPEGNPHWTQYLLWQYLWNSQHPEFWKRGFFCIEATHFIHIFGSCELSEICQSFVCINIPGDKNLQ